MNDTFSISIKTKSLNVLTNLLISIYNHDQHKNEILSYLTECLPSINLIIYCFIDWFNLLNNSLNNSTYIKETLSFYTSLFKFYGILASHYINVLFIYYYYKHIVNSSIFKYNIRINQ